MRPRWLQKFDLTRGELMALLVLVAILAVITMTLAWHGQSVPPAGAMPALDEGVVTVDTVPSGTVGGSKPSTTVRRRKPKKDSSKAARRDLERRDPLSRPLPKIE